MNTKYIHVHAEQSRTRPLDSFGCFISPSAALVRRFRILRPRAAGAGALVPLFRAQSLSTTSVSAAGSGPSQEEIFRYWQWCVQVRLLQASAGLPPLPYGIPLVVCSAGPGELRVFARVATVSRGSSGRSQRAAAPTSIDGRVAAKHTRAFILFEALGYDVTISGSEISQFALALSSSFSRTASDPAALVNPDTAASSDEPREVIGVARDRVVDAGWGSAGMDVSALAEEDDDHLFCMTPLQNFYGIGAGGETLSTGLGVGIGEDAVDECLGLDSPSKASRVKALSTTFTTSKSQVRVTLGITVQLLEKYVRSRVPRGRCSRVCYVAFAAANCEE